MASAWVRRVELPSGSLRYRVVWSAAGREATRRYGGSDVGVERPSQPLVSCP